LWTIFVTWTVISDWGPRLKELSYPIGVQLEGGETIAADWVISAAYGHTTIYDLLGGQYRNKIIDKTYTTLKPFPSYLQVSLGVPRDLSLQAAYVTRVLHTPLKVDPETELSQVSLLLSLRSDVCATWKDCGHLLSSDTQRRVLDRTPAARPSRIPSGEAARCGSRHCRSGKGYPQYLPGD
jgi:hypothetical protein